MRKVDLKTDKTGQIKKHESRPFLLLYTTTEKVSHARRYSMKPATKTLPSLKDVKEVTFGFKDLDILCLNFDGVKSLTYGEMKVLDTVLESNVFDNVAKCFILDNRMSKLVPQT